MKAASAPTAKPEPDATAKPLHDAFESDLAHPRTLRLDNASFVFMPRADGSVDLVIYHGGQTMASGFSPQQVAVMASAMAPPGDAPRPARGYSAAGVEKSRAATAPAELKKAGGA